MKRVVKYLHKRKGLLFSVIYLLSTFISCFVLLFFDNDIKHIFYKYFINEYQIDKVAFLSIVTAIIIAIVTTLTLSISIEGNDGNKRFGKTPKELNDYLDYPISLNCAFAGLIIYFVFSICFMKFGCTTTFYFFSLTTLGYYFVSLLIGLPVITGDSKKVYDVISRSLNSNDAVSSKDASNVILYLFSKGYSIEEIYKNLNMSLITNQKNVVKVILNLYLEFIISGNENGEIFRRHCKNFENTLYSLTSDSDASIFIGCGDEVYSIIYAFYRKKVNVADWIYHFAIKYSGYIKNKDNAELLEDVFYKFIAWVFQANEFSILCAIKRYICEFDFGTLLSKESRLRFFFLSFILCVYLKDSKVPGSYKSSINDLINKNGSDIRFEELSWSSIFNKIIRDFFDIDKKTFLDLLLKYEERFEFTIYGKVYTPIVTKEHALRFYWYSLLCFSGEKDVDQFFVFNKNYDELHYFKTFILDIQNNKFKPCLIFSGVLRDTNYISEVNSQTFDSINQLLSDIQKQILNDNLAANHKEQSEIIDTCKKQIESSLSALQIGRKIAGCEHKSLEFTFRYDDTFELDMNAKVISMNAVSRVRQCIMNLLNIIHLRDKTKFDTILGTLMYKKKKIYINDTYKKYCDYNILKGLTNKRTKKANVFTSPLFVDPTCFVSNLPYIGNISANLYEKELSEIDIEILKNQYDNKAGVYIFQGSPYTLDEFIGIMKQVYRNVAVRIEFDYCSSKGAILHPFNQ